MKGGDEMVKIIKKTINFPLPIVEKVKEYQEANMLTTFTSALLELVRKGLDK